MDTKPKREDAPDRAGEQSTSDLSAKAKADVRDVAGHLTEEARNFAEQQRAAGADNVERLGRAVHEAADQLGRELPQAAGFIHSAADTLQSASSSLRDRSVEDMTVSFTNFARRQPAAAFVGSVLAGFALARFMKSSSPREERRAE